MAKAHHSVLHAMDAVTVLQEFMRVFMKRDPQRAHPQKTYTEEQEQIYFQARLNRSFYKRNLQQGYDTLRMAQGLPVVVPQYNTVELFDQHFKHNKHNT